MLKHLFHIVFLFCAFNLNAQIWNIWMFGEGGGLDFNHDPPAFFNSPSKQALPNIAICDSAGKLKFYFNGKNIYNSLNQIICNGDNFDSILKSNFSTDWGTFIFPFSKNKYVFITNTEIDNNNTGFYWHIIDMNANFGEGCVISKHNLLKNSTGNNNFTTAAIHPDGNSYWLIQKRYPDSFLVYRIFSDSVFLEKKIHIPLYGFLTKPQLYNSPLIKLSNNQDLLVECFTGYNDSVKSEANYIMFYDFNELTGEISNNRVIFFEPSNQNNNTYSVTAFSPNDSFIYIYNNRKYKIMQFERFANNVYESRYEFDICCPVRISIAPDGKIYTIDGSRHLISVFNYPNKKGKDAFFEANKIKGSEIPTVNSLVFTFYQNLSLNAKYNAECGNIHFTAIYDTNNYNKITWYLTEEDSIVGKNSNFSFKKSGSYIIKYKAENKYGYKRWFSDTITFFQKPIANFTTDTTIGCQWLKFKFYDASVKDTVNAAIGESWLWHFGDGGSSTQQNPEHIYTQTGKYKVKLIYSNGFCTDTIEKEQAVEIIEAPRPGFAMSQTNYCSPYTLQITDTSLGRVQTWHYDFGDGNSDSTASPSHRFPYAGTYKIVQILTGPTGCVTKDSALLHLRPGFEGTEGINSLTTVVVDNSSILLNWQKHEDAFSYDLFRSSNDTNYPKLLNLTDSFFLDDKLIRDDQVYAYKIKGIDSCSRPSDFSRKLKNIVLTGEAFKSEYSILRWTPFELWQQGVKEYVLEYAGTNGDFVPLLSTAKREIRDDDFFTGEKQFEKCYRVVAIEQQGNQQQSISNTLCLPYEATFFIPTAFTPNGDGLNDTFFVRGISVENIHVRIYNRWGQLIFQTTDLYEGWDGSYKGKACPIGAYSCLVTGKRKGGKFINTSITISLLR